MQYPSHVFGHGHSTSIDILRKITMELSIVYALVAGGFFGILSLVQIVQKLFDLLNTPLQVLKRYIIYPYLIRRHHVVGPLTRARCCLIVIFFVVNVFCCALKASSKAFESAPVQVLGQNPTQTFAQNGKPGGFLVGTGFTGAPKILSAKPKLASSNIELAQYN